MSFSYDVLVIGGGVVGGLISRELTRLNLKVGLLEKANDLAMGATKANSAIVHGGFDAAPDSLKAKFNVEGTAMMPALCRDLEVLFGNNGSLVVAFDEDDMETVQALYRRGEENGVTGLEILNKEELLELEPEISAEAVGALRSSTAGIVCPYELTIAAVENAVKNGLDFQRNCEVLSIEFVDGVFVLETSLGEFRSKYVVNAAGVYAGEVARMIGDESINIQPRLGEYYLLDKSVGFKVMHTIFQCPGKMGKGVLVTPTVDGNLLIGPTALDIDDKADVSTTIEGLERVRTLALRSVPSLSIRDAITSFAGLRAHPDGGDFIIGSSEVNRQMIHAAGIESPGLSAAPAIAVHVRELLTKMEKGVSLKEDFDPLREKPVRFRAMSDEDREKLIEKNIRYGRIVCRCEMVTEGEIVDAIHAPAGARDMDGIKRRTRSGMGRCQSGFCGSKVMEILARELELPVNEITKFGGGSKVLYEKTK